MVLAKGLARRIILWRMVQPSNPAKGGIDEVLGRGANLVRRIVRCVTWKPASVIRRMAVRRWLTRMGAVGDADAHCDDHLKGLAGPTHGERQGLQYRCHAGRLATLYRG